MIKLLVIAWRNVWRNSRRSGIAIAAMSLALWAELVYSGMIAGLVDDMVAQVTSADTGDVQVFTPRWLDRPSISETVDDEAILARLDAAGYPATARLQAGGLAASGDLSSGVALVGLDPVRDAKVLSVASSVADGLWLDPTDEHGVVVGRGLARSLDLKIGSELVVLSQGADGSMANDLFHVRGILSSVGSGTDRSAVMMVEPMFRELMALPAGAHRIVVRAPPGVSLDEATAKVAALAPEAKAESWKQLNPFVAQMVDGVKVQVKVIYFILYVAVAILVLNAMLMAVFERIREFGILKAIGYGPWRVFVIMVFEGLFQAGVASVIGAVLAVPFMAYLSTHGLDIGALSGASMLGMTMPTVWHGTYTAEGLKVPVIMLFGIVFAAVAYPAAKAAWIRPIDAIHHQ